MAAKKTTLMIDDGLYADVRRRAAERGESVSAIVSEAIRRYIIERPNRTPIEFELPTSDAPWEFPFDGSSNVEMLDFLDKNLPIEKLR